MATKTFSGRVDEKKLAFADMLTRKEYGVSFGQYCGSVLVNTICEHAELPYAPSSAVNSQRSKDASILKSMSDTFRDSKIGAMSDAQIRDLLASRYA